MVMNRAKLIFTAIGIIVALCISNMASAENKTFIKEYTYMAGDNDSKVSSRAIALEQVKRALLEQLGTYLISETEVKNFKLTKDQVSTLTAGIVSAEVVDEKWDGRSYYLKAKIAADPKEVAKSVDVLRNDVQKSKELEDSKKQAQESMKEVERLKKELDLVKGDANKIQVAYTKAINHLSATDWYDKGIAFAQFNNDKDAIYAFNKAVELNPIFAPAYTGRGISYAWLKNNRQAIKDFNKAIELNPFDYNSYNGRGYVYDHLGNSQKAIKDFNKSIELNSKNAYAYAYRGIVYQKIGDYARAIADANKAIGLDPKEYFILYNIAIFYSNDANVTEACKWLMASVEGGFSDWKHIKEDDAFDNIRNSSCYKNIMRGK